MTDENGMYTFTGLKYAYDYKVSIWDDHLNQEFYYAIPDHEICSEYIPDDSALTWENATTIKPAYPLLNNIDIITCNLTKQKGKIMGMIAVNDAPALNVWVYAFSEVLNCGNGAYSDENGYYTITDYR